MDSPEHNDAGNAAARETLAQAIDRRLPQTQCELCGHRGCLAYARAIAAGRDEINRCPPGGAVTTDALARLLGRATPQPASPPPPLQVARIREADCIGCALCIKACPVDCIVGAAKLMHSVIADECSGCELCLPACPTDCIEMTPRAAPQQQEQAQDARETPSIWSEFTQPQVEKWRRRAEQKRAREFSARRERATRGASGTGRRELQREILAAVRRKQAGAACRRA